MHLFYTGKVLIVKCGVKLISLNLKRQRKIETCFKTQGFSELCRGSNQLGNLHANGMNVNKCIHYLKKNTI